jgi:hypothetical protein
MAATSATSFATCFWKSVEKNRKKDNKIGEYTHQSPKIQREGLLFAIQMDTVDVPDDIISGLASFFSRSFTDQLRTCVNKIIGWPRRCHARWMP